MQLVIITKYRHTFNVSSDLKASDSDPPLTSLPKPSPKNAFSLLSSRRCFLFLKKPSGEKLETYEHQLHPRVERATGMVFFL